jgi:hypothetical protein
MAATKRRRTDRLLVILQFLARRGRAEGVHLASPAWKRAGSRREEQFSKAPICRDIFSVCGRAWLAVSPLSTTENRGEASSILALAISATEAQLSCSASPMMMPSGPRRKQSR